MLKKKKINMCVVVVVVTVQEAILLKSNTLLRDLHTCVKHIERKKLFQISYFTDLCECMHFNCYEHAICSLQILC